MKKMLPPSATLVTLAACAPAYTPTASKPDSELSCLEIKAEIARAQDARTQAQNNKGVSGQNVAWFLFFWPGIIGNELNNSQVIQKADERIGQMNQAYTAKNCAATEAAK